MLNSSNQKWVQLKNGLLYQKFTEILYDLKFKLLSWKLLIRLSMLES